MLKKWFYGKRDKYSGKRIIGALDKAPNPDLPYLPDARQYTLTPANSTESLSQPCSPLFDKVPFEIRRQILVQAFGQDLLHMDLSLSHPVAEAATENPVTGLHSDSHANVFGQRLDHSRPERWQWWGSVCHRIPPADLRSSMDRYKEIDEPGDDRCREGIALFCGAQSDNAPSECQIGAMGWLLACRQA